MELLTGSCKQKFYILYDSNYRKIDEIEEVYVEALIINFFNFHNMWKEEFNIQFSECDNNFFKAVKKTIEVCNCKFNILEK